MTRILKHKRLGRGFFVQPTIKVCRDILGKYIVRKWRGKEIIGRIVEVEAYIGPEDKASHAFDGKITKRNVAEYMIGGYVYIYLVYGMYWQFNISTGKAGHPECILIRAVEPVQGLRDKEGAGPGKFCRVFRLDKSFYGEDVTKSKRLWLEDWGEPLKEKIIASPRIGIDYAGPIWAKKPWRFYLKGNKYVSGSRK